MALRQRDIRKKQAEQRKESRWRKRIRGKGYNSWLLHEIFGRKNQRRRRRI